MEKDMAENRPTVTLLIVEDESIIRNGLKKLNWEAFGISLVQACSNSYEAEKLLGEQSVDILLSDICMPGKSGIELSKWARAKYPKLRLLFLTGYREFDYIHEALLLNASDYILKPASPGEIIAKVCRERDTLLGTEAQESNAEAPKVYRQIPAEEKQTLICKLLLYLDGHYAEPVSMSTLTGTFHFSAVYLSRYIKSETGYTFVELLTALRMWHAKQLAQRTDLPNSQICEMVGICDEKYLGQLFKKHYGVTLSKYRKGGAVTYEEEIAALFKRCTGKNL